MNANPSRRSAAAYVLMLVAASLCARAAVCAAEAPASAPSAVPAGAVTLYVSPAGSDAWSGRLSEPNAARTDGPLATPAAARNALRRLRPNLRAGAVVFLRGGTYRLAEPLVLEPQDGAEGEATVRWAAFENEKPVLSGGEIIAGWKQGNDSLWSAPCGWAVGEKAFKQLWISGSRRRRARTPNAGDYFTIASASVGRDAAGRDLPKSHQAFVFAPGDVKDWPDREQALFVVMHSWETSLLRPARIDLPARTVTFTGPAAWHFENWGPGQRYYVENVLEALDAPGEWYLDGKTGLLQYIPMRSERFAGEPAMAMPGAPSTMPAMPPSASVVAPRLARLLELRGQADQGQFVRNVRFEGLTFSHQDYVLKPAGYSDAQAAFSVEAAVMADGARSCAFEGCEISHVGGYGLWLRRGCKDCRVVRCRLSDLGAGGVRVGEVVRAAADELESSHNVVENNHIFDGGHVYAAGVGIWVAQSSHNVIRHNDVHDFDYSGMSIGWNWDDAPNRTHHNLIELNHVHHVLRGVLSDGGAIYTLGVSTGSVIRRNHFHDVWAYRQPPYGWGVYLDGTTSGYTVEHNLVYNTTSGGFMCSNGGHENVVRNNVFALHAEHTLWPYWHKKPNTFRRNIVYLTQGNIFVPFTESSLRERLKAGDGLGDWDQNLYWRHDSAPPMDPPQPLKMFRMDWPQWQALGLDRNSLVADPQFVDAGKYDFRLKPTSPALKLGIESVDVSAAGLYGDPAWVKEARQAARPPQRLPPPPPPPAPRTIADDFEATAEGAAPRDATVSGEEHGARISVSAQRAAGGRHSLKVQDSKALEPAWQPHFFYSPYLRRGTVRQAFDVWLEPGCLVQVEWRDQSLYPQCIGPSVRLQAGAVHAAGRKLADLPSGAWVRVEIEAELKSGKYTLALTPAGGQRQAFADLPCAGSEFGELHWAGFISLHAADAAFFLDNMDLRAK